MGHKNQQLNYDHLHLNLHILMELLIPGQKFDDVSGQIRSHNPTPDAVYFVFDIPDYPAGKEERYCYIALHEACDTKSVSYIPSHKVYDENWLHEIHEKFIDNGEEGSVICDPAGEYEFKRSWGWMKLVPVLTEDLPVVAFFEGTGKNKGKLGGIVVEFKSVRVPVGTGFTDEQRTVVWDNSVEYLGKTAEVEYKEVSKFGSLRQPRFKCWRWDK